MGRLIEGKVKMTKDSQRKEDARENGKKRMSDEEFDREMIELKARFNYVEQLL
jgi:hypothetical protein